MSALAVSGSTEKHDARVEVHRGEGIEITSPVHVLFGEQQRAAVASVLREEGVSGYRLVVADNHALDFVLRARTRAALQRVSVQSARHGGIDPRGKDAP